MSRSADLFTRAQQCIPGGVNSPVRAFKGVGGNPLFFRRGQDAYLYDEDGHAYIDYVGSWGPLILGHAHPEVIAAVQQAATQGLSFGAPTELEIELAETICQLMPSIAMVRMVNSGTEATMSALRLARAYTGRDKIVKFVGCYHGHSDSLLAKAGSGLLTLGIPSSPGIPADITQHTLTAEFNDLDQVEALFQEYGEQIAAIIVEPIAGNMNFIKPMPDFLPGLRNICDDYGSLLIFDEVMTGFRVALGGAQAYYQVQPDLTTLGKVIGGGMPVGAFGGRREIMEWIAPIGNVYQAGTLSGNPIAMTAGLVTLKLLQQPHFYEQLQQTTVALINGLQQRAHQAGIDLAVDALGGMFGFFFTSAKTVTNYQQATACNIQQFRDFYHRMLAKGIYFAPSAFEAGFVSAAHGQAEINHTLTAAAEVFEQMRCEQGVLS